MSLALVLSVLVLLLLPCQRRLAKATQTRWRVPWAAKLLLAVGCGRLALGVCLFKGLDLS